MIATFLSLSPPRGSVDLFTSFFASRHALSQLGLTTGTGIGSSSAAHAA